MINFTVLTKAQCTVAPYIGMKTYHLKLITVFALAALFLSCADRFPASYILELPKPPEHWVDLLGEPCWRIEWISSDGIFQMTEIQPEANIKAEIPLTWANPVIASPFWPQHNLYPGYFRPAGAIFPFDAEGNRLKLTWEGGVDSVFYKELTIANEENLSRIPANFDWPRFRELLKDEAINEAVREDPWLVNWRSVAERTITGNFDRRRLVPEGAVQKNIPVPAGVWYGTSPFCKPLIFTEGEPPIFPVRPGTNTWFSKEGILRANAEVWIVEIWN